MKNIKIDYKTELKNNLLYLFNNDFRLEQYNENAQGGLFNFFHLSECYNALIYYNFDDVYIKTDLQYTQKITVLAQRKAEKCARAYIMLVKQGKRATAEKIIDYFVNLSRKVFQYKYSIENDINFYNL